MTSHLPSNFFSTVAQSLLLHCAQSAFFTVAQSSFDLTSVVVRHSDLSFPSVMNFSLNSSIQLKATKAHRETEAPLPLTCGGEDSTIFISDDGEEEEAADDNDDDNDDFRMLSPQEVEQFSSRQSKNKQLPPGHSYRDHVTTKDALRVSREMTVERKDGGFFKIKRIIQNNTAGIILQGIPLQRHSDICPPSEGRSDYPLLRKVLNDVCMVLKCAPEENLDSVDQLCFEKMPLEDVVRKREILFTNRRPKDDEPHLHTQICRSLDKQRHKEHVRNHGTLHCRWVYVEEIDLVKGKTTGDHLLRRLTFGECTSGRRIPDVMLRQDYGKKNVTKSTNDRGSVERKRSAMQAAEVVDLSTDDDVFTTLAGSQHLRFSQPQYTFADICAGGGGVTCGADLAGLKPVLAVDNCEVATQTLKANFPGTRVVQIDIEEFALISRHRVDVVHISLPCQGLSFQNRGQNPVLDDMNNRLGTVLESLISNLRPRAITMEQTNGALTKHDGLWYRKYIQQLTELGYSVRWKVCNMGDTGHVQGRRRLMIQAAWYVLSCFPLQDAG